MTGDAVNGRNGCGARAGARTLSLLAAPLNARALRALEDGAKKQVDLRREVGQPAQTTLRAQLKRLAEAGMIEKRRRNRFPGVLEYELSEAGRDLLRVADVLGGWLERSPESPLELGGGPAKAAIKALTEGWSTAMLRALAAKPLTLTELDRMISALNYPSVERRLAAMRLAGLIDAREGDGRGTPYGVTDWARRGVAPLLAAARWERRHAPAEAPPPARLDIEAALLLSDGLLSPPAGVSGSCQLAVELRNAGASQLAGILIDVRDGKIASRTTRLQSNADAWASGTLPAWFAAVIDRDVDGLELGGDSALVRSLIDAFHGALFPLPVVD